MKIASLVLVALGLTPPLHAAAPAAPVSGLIVKLEPAGGEPRAVPAYVAPAMAASLGSTAGHRLTVARRLSGRSTRLRFETPVSAGEAAAAAAALSARADVRYAVPDYRRFPTAVPNDPRYAEQWYLHSALTEPGAASLPDAWDLTTGSAAVVVAVLDTGILASHLDLSRILAGYDFVENIPGTGIDFENDADGGRDADPSDPGDGVAAGECGPSTPAVGSSWHGTHVTGVIGATADNSLGIAGIDHQARILPVRVLGKCGGLDSDILDGARWAAGLSVPGLPDNPTPARVINMSLGGFGECNAAFRDAFAEVTQRSVLVVVAAGNEAVDLAATPVAPAVCEDAFTVAATTRQGAETDYTNIGSAVDLAAPGGARSTVAAGILSTSDSGTAGPANDSAYAPAIGTSFSAPVVSGVAALMLALNADLTPLHLARTLQASARSFPIGTSDGFGDCDDTRCGDGLVDARAAVVAVRDGDIPGFYAGGRKIELLGDASDRSSSLLAGGPLALLAVLGALLLRRRQ